jgi:hypothetical protein
MYTSSARQRLRSLLIIFADFYTYVTGELITLYFPHLLQPPLPPQLYSFLKIFYDYKIKDSSFKLCRNDKKRSTFGLVRADQGGGGKLGRSFMYSGTIFNFVREEVYWN